MINCMINFHPLFTETVQEKILWFVFVYVIGMYFFVKIKNIKNILYIKDVQYVANGKTEII